MGVVPGRDPRAQPRPQAVAGLPHGLLGPDQPPHLCCGSVPSQEVAPRAWPNCLASLCCAFLVCKRGIILYLSGGVKLLGCWGIRQVPSKWPCFCLGLSTPLQPDEPGWGPCVGLVGALAQASEETPFLAG